MKKAYFGVKYKTNRDTKVVTVTRWYAQDEVNQEDSEQNEVDGMKKGADSTGSDAYERAVGDL